MTMEQMHGFSPSPLGALVVVEHDAGSEALPKMHPLKRSETYSTYGLSSCDASSTTQRPEDGGDSDDLGTLSRLSLKYRRGCLSMEKRHSRSLSEPRYYHGEDCHSPILDLLQQSFPFPKPAPPTLVQEDEQKPAARKKLAPLPALMATQSLPHQSSLLPPLSRGLREDPHVFPADQEEVLRQQEILDDIKRRRSAAQQPRLNSAFTSGHVTGREAGPPATTRSCRRPARRSSREDCESQTDIEKVIVKDGRRVRVKGTEHTYRSIIQGQATLVQCPSCQTVLQIGAAAKLLYCTCCEQVSPIRREENSQGGSNTTMDNQIASAVQRQELNIARTIRRSKQQSPVAV